MEVEKAARYAVALNKNALLPEIFDARAQELREAWESETESTAAREQLWCELKALNDLKDFIYARLRELIERERIE